MDINYTYCSNHFTIHVGQVTLLYILNLCPAVTQQNWREKKYQTLAYVYKEYMT